MTNGQTVEAGQPIKVGSIVRLVDDTYRLGIPPKFTRTIGKIVAVESYGEPQVRIQFINSPAKFYCNLTNFALNFEVLFE